MQRSLVLGLTIFLVQCALNAASVSTVTHQMTGEDGGRILMTFGESAQFKVNSDAQSITVTIDSSSIVSNQAELVDAVPMPGCELQFDNFKQVARFMCKDREILKVNSTMVSDPRRMVVEYKTRGRTTSRKVAGNTDAQSTKKSTPKGAKSAVESGFEITLQPPQVVAEVKEEPTSNKGINLGRELNYLERARLRTRTFVRFVPLRKEISFKYQMPDYQVMEDSSEISNMYNLALKLFREKRYGLALRTIDFIRKKDPAHQIWQVLSFLEAELYVKLAEELQAPRYFQEAISRYKAAFGKYPQSPFFEPGISHVGKIQLDRGENYGAIDTFMAGLETFKESQLRDDWKLGISEAIFRQNRFAEARKIYLELSDLKDSTRLTTEGRYRVGDTYMAMEQYDLAIMSYFGAISKELGFQQDHGVINQEGAWVLPASIKEFPSTLFNLGEAAFWSGRYAESLWAYRKFLDLHPLHENRALALARVGELLDIFGANAQESRGAFLEAKFRHPSSRGADIATLRESWKDLVEGDDFQKRHAELEFATMEQKYSNDTEMIDFITNLRAEVLMAHRKYLEGYAMLNKDIFFHPSRPYRKLYRAKTHEFLQLGFRELRRSGRCTELFKIYEEKRTIFFANDNPFFDQYLEAALCGLKANLPGLSMEFMKIYEKDMAEAQKRRDQWREAVALQTIIDPTEINFYKAVAELQQGQVGSAADRLEAVLKDKKLDPYILDSARMYLVLANLKLGDAEKAHRYMNEIGDKSIFYLYPHEILEEVTKLRRSKEYSTAMGILDDLLRTMISPAKQVPIWMAKAQVFWLQGNRKEAVKIYRNVVDLSLNESAYDSWSNTFEKPALGSGSETAVQRIQDLQLSLRSRIDQPEIVTDLQAMSAYRIGLDLRESGKISESVEFFTKAATTAPKSTWAISANSELDSIQFRNKYQETINQTLNRKPSNQRRKQ